MDGQEHAVAEYENQQDHAKHYFFAAFATLQKT